MKSVVKAVFQLVELNGKEGRKRHETWVFPDGSVNITTTLEPEVEDEQERSVFRSVDECITRLSAINNPLALLLRHFYQPPKDELGKLNDTVVTWNWARPFQVTMTVRDAWKITSDATIVLDPAAAAEAAERAEHIARVLD